MNIPTQKSKKIKNVKKVVYFCGFCNKVVGNNCFCKPCNYQFMNKEIDDV